MTTTTTISNTPLTAVVLPMSPTRTTTTTQRENRDPQVAVETVYRADDTDSLLLLPGQIVLERGLYGAPYRETLAIRTGADRIGKAVTDLVRFCALELKANELSAADRERYTALLADIRKALPKED